MTRPDFTDPTGVEGDYTTPADGSHVKTTTQVKTLGNTAQYPNTEAGVKSVLRSEIDAEMSGAHFSLWSIFKNLFDGVGEVLSGIAGPALGMLGNIAGGLISGFIGLVSGFASVIESVFNRKPVPRDTPETFSAIAADLEGALEPFHEKVDEALGTARDSTKKAEALNTKLEQELDPTLENSSLWVIQNAINAAHDEADKALGIAIEANKKSISTMSEYVQRMHFIPAGVAESNEHWLVTRSGSNVTLKAKPGWTGTAIYMYSQDVQRPRGDMTSEGGFDGGYHRHKYEDRRTIMDSALVTPGDSFTLKPTGAIIVHYSVSPGTARTTTIRGTSLTPDSEEWTRAASWRLPTDTQFTASAKYTFAAKTHLASYGGRFTLDGTTVSNGSTSGGAPLFGHGPRAGSVSASPMSGKKGQVLALEVYAKHSNSLNRQVTSPVMEINWIEPPAES